jgi:hypothetical protein
MGKGLIGCKLLSEYVYSELGRSVQTGESLLELVAELLQSQRGAVRGKSVSTRKFIEQHRAIVEAVAANRPAPTPVAQPSHAKKTPRKKTAPTHAKANRLHKPPSSPAPVYRQVFRQATPIPAGMDVVSDSFLSTYEWRRVRMMALKKYGARCQCCGASPADGAVMNVDHIKPRRLFPALALDVDNLQILCAPCNHGKGNWDMTDWREPEPAIDSLPWAEEAARQAQHMREIARESAP